jgi:hypothetical protein
VRLSATISRMLGSVAQSYDIRDQREARAALAFFDANESLSSRAKSEADELQTQIIADISSRIRAARGNKGLLEAILHAAPAGIGLRPARPARALAMAR